MGEVIKLRQLRWTAVIFYRTNNGLEEQEIDIEEISDLQEHVEQGPDWNTIDRIEVRLSRSTEPGLTVEQAILR